MHIRDGFMSKILLLVVADDTATPTTTASSSGKSLWNAKNEDVCWRKAQLWPFNVYFLRNQTPEVCATQPYVLPTYGYVQCW